MAETFEPRDFAHKGRSLHVLSGEFSWAIIFPDKQAAKQAHEALTQALDVIGLEVGIDDIVWVLRLNGITVTVDK